MGTDAVCAGRTKRSIIVHHRVPGRSVLRLMISLCPGCHAKVHRTLAVRRQMSPLLLKLWREQHPRGHEQRALEFTPQVLPVQNVALFHDLDPSVISSLRLL